MVAIVLPYLSVPIGSTLIAFPNARSLVNCLAFLPNGCCLSGQSMLAKRILTGELSLRCAQGQAGRSLFNNVPPVVPSSFLLKDYTGFSSSLRGHRRTGF